MTEPTRRRRSSPQSPAALQSHRDERVRVERDADRRGSGRWDHVPYADDPYTEDRYAVDPHRSRGARGPGRPTRSPWAQDLARTMSPPAGGDRGPRGSRSPGGKVGGPGRSRRLGRRLLAATAWMTVLAVAGGFVVYRQLGSNLQSAALFSGVGGDAGTQRADQFGRVPLNVLVIGSDTRSSQVNCRIGGACRNGGAGANADVQMVVHVAADRSNATVMSVPRDTVTELPACRSSKGATMRRHVGLINSTLAYGPGCTVAAVHHLTGIPIDHFVMVDFAGVVAMSDAVGGARVCVNADVYDPYSHLKLAKGTHTLKGLAALQFVRSRHAFGDGSDLGRTYAQHVFLSAVIRNLKSAGTLANPVALYGLASAATKALTVDEGLASVPSLLGLAATLNKVPTDRITFTTMQNVPDPADRNRVVPAPTARALFDLIANDRPLGKARKGGGTGGVPSGGTGPAGDPNPGDGTDSGESGSQAGSQAGSRGARTFSGGTTLTAAERARVAVRVMNGSGRGGRASAIAAALTAQGFSPRTSSVNAPVRSVATRLEYGAGQRAAAEAVAGVLGLPATALRPSTAAGPVLVVGADWPVGTTFPTGVTATPGQGVDGDRGTDRGAGPGTGQGSVTADAATLRQAHARTADQDGTCVAVSTQNTVVVDGVGMNPTRAYRVSTRVRPSAP